ncbi:2-amino-4-hydroxy-6-hydroxymethyldihydropteridine diphosphokinase [Parabacteroides sp. An277]|uniref:2-amino-4-hydroxy-6- hydroxymethyldihydropteridine diphosphokinase n=1 Tax=Parabacteroides sp. An277 TaxID=1965619 RepID=UPI000B574D9A|nr:2-amino-4-hydroxy-6-hydroxymethyldihydropteridine diphosphokinase [Parabacteroides sp. An277]OUO55497.1 2-amino-4-hydroxy-6-hydroxymethyldihydropteridine diphosphokinase [Parabacteroides sp. An277]
MKAYLGLGSNLGNRRRNLITAAALLAERAGDVLALSSFYETEPWGFVSENRFLNAALALETSLSPFDLLRLTQTIEREMGRAAKSAQGIYHDRLIDIDLLLYGDEVVRSAELEIPHPHLHERRFVLEPLREIAPFLRHPLLGKNIEELFRDFTKSTQE